MGLLIQFGETQFPNNTIWGVFIKSPFSGLLWLCGLGGGGGGGGRKIYQIYCKYTPLYCGLGGGGRGGRRISSAGNGARFIATHHTGSAAPPPNIFYF